ncbi:hypothetical protein ON010_g871 [Phytophthora cinnamomi]|nr:hypothetical protein ON010_g871 [Phytophthora cinnamomi]
MFRPVFVFASQNAILYILNDHHSPQWFYDYNSGSAKRKREMEHVFAAYVLALHELSPQYPRYVRSPAARMATVVARASSPPFTLVSYRRQPVLAEEKRASPTRQTDRSGVSVEVARTVEGMPLYRVEENAMDLWHNDRDGQDENRYNGDYHITQDLRAVDEWIMSDADDEETEEDNRQQQFQGRARSANSHWPSSPMNRCQICLEPHDMLTNSLRCDIIELLRPVLMLQHFLLSVPLDAFDFYFDDMDFRIQHRWLAKTVLTDPRQPLHRSANAVARTLVDQMTSTFSLAMFVPGQSFSSRPSSTAVLTAVSLPTATPARTPAREQPAGGSTLSDPTPHSQMVLQSCADLLLDVFSSLRVRQMLAVAVNATLLTEGCDRFSQVVQDLVDELSQLLASRTRLNAPPRVCIHGHVTPRHNIDDCGSISALVEDILQWTVSDPKYHQLYRSLLTFRDSEPQAAAHQLFRGFVEQQWQHQGVRGKSAGYARGQNEVDISSLPTNMSDELFFPARSVEPARSVYLANSSLAATRWNGRWFLVPNSISLSPVKRTCGVTSNFNIAPSSGVAPSLLTVIGLIRVFSVLDVTLDGSYCVIESGMSEPVQGAPKLPATVLVLDERSRRLDSYPNGLSAAASAAVFGVSWNVVAYKGRMLDHGSSLELLFFFLPINQTRIGENSGQTVRQLRVKLVLGTTHSYQQSCLSLFTEVAAAQYPAQHPNPGGWNLDNAPAERSFEHLQSLLWSVVLEGSVSYASVSQVAASEVEVA